ncbi:MAG: hypothetical protein ACP5HG_06730 [Anaerolineae bacterium]
MLSGSGFGAQMREALIVHANPSVRAMAMLELAGLSPDDAAVKDARAAAAAAWPVQKILEAQYPAGYWMHPGLGISPHYRATVWQVLFLAQLGAPPSRPVQRAVEAVHRSNCDTTGALRLRRGVTGRSAALTGAVLWAVARLGLADEARWRSTWRWVEGSIGVDDVRPDAVTWLARAAAAWPRPDLVAELTTHLRTDWDEMARMPLTFPLAYQPDGLAHLQAWAEVGQAHRIPGACLEALAARRLPSGDWPQERLLRPLWFDPGAIGDPNPWITVRVLSLFLQADAA